MRRRRKKAGCGSGLAGLSKTKDYFCRPEESESESERDSFQEYIVAVF
jgi:hypothetical protein